MRKLILLAILLINEAVAVFASSNPPPGLMETPYESCKDIYIVSRNEYAKDSGERKVWEEKCDKEIQFADDPGFFDLTTIDSNVQYLNFARKVAEKVSQNLEKSIKYARCSSACFIGARVCTPDVSDTGNEVNCEGRKNEILKGLKKQSRIIRKELALSQDLIDNIFVNKNNIRTLSDEKLLNSTLGDFETATPNPLGRNKLSPIEEKHLLAVIKRERRKMDQEYWKMLKEKNVKHSPETQSYWVMEQYNKIREEHQSNYRQLIYEKYPIFSVIEKPVRFDHGEIPVWDDKQIANGFMKLVENGEMTLASTKKAISRNKLEFSRINGEATAEWLKQMRPGKSDSNDLLYFLGMTAQVEKVLKEDNSNCALATSLFNRLSSRELQNTGAITLASFAGGPLWKTASKSVTGIFRIGRTLTGAEASALNGLGMGTIYLGDSFRLHDSITSETIAGLRGVEQLKDARNNVALNLVFAPAMIPSGWITGKVIYNTSAKRMEKEFPELSNLMTKAETSESARDELVDKWMAEKVKSFVKKGVLSDADEKRLKTEEGKKLLDIFVSDVDKNAPGFFNDPKNFDLLLKAVSSTVKRRPGDPDDLVDKAKYLFLKLDKDAFKTWDPVARKNLMHVFDNAVEELRIAHSNNPAAYAKFTVDSDAQEKIMLNALKRSGVIDESDAKLMNKCVISR